MTRIRAALLSVAAAAALLLLAPLLSAQSPTGSQVTVLTINGAIGPATSDYFLRGLKTAEVNGAGLVVLVMDTPGGLDSSMRDIIKGILSSPVPVASFVSPSGSRAASAGTYILYASHVAAMAPATNLGAATPVQIGGSPPDKPKPEPGDKTGSNPVNDNNQPPSPESGNAAKSGSAMERKAINDAIAYIRGLAELRKRNADWAEEAVLNAASLSAEEALKMNVIDLVATDMADLLAQINGRTFDAAGRPVTIDTSAAVIERIDPDWRSKLLGTLTNPNVAYLLMLIGIYGLLFEGYNPGAIVPGVVGAISLLLALYAFQVLSVNYAGLALILLGVILIISEVFVPSFGALGIGGIVAFVIGSIILIDTDVPGFGIDRTLIGTFAVAGGSLMMAIVWLAVRARAMPVVTGKQQMLGSLAEAVTDIDGTGTVFVHGENWTASSGYRISRGDTVRITAINGLQLEVEPHPGGGKTNAF